METNKFRLWQRVLSLVLAAGILCGVMPVSVLAESINDPENVVVEYQPEQATSEPASPESTPTAEQPQPTTPSANSEAVPPASSSEATPPASSTPPDSSASSSVPADSVPADSSSASSVPEEPATVEQITQQLTADGATITVSYFQDAFAEKVSAVATRITEQSDKSSYDATLAALENDEAVEFEDFAAFDITFFNEKGEMVEPLEGKTVSVSVVLNKDVVPADAENLNVVHIDDTLKTEVMTAATTVKTEEGGASAVASFETPSFSTFVITWGSNNAQVIVHYIDEQGNSLTGAQTTNVKINWNQEISFNQYAADHPLAVLGYTYKEAWFEGNPEKIVSSVKRSSDDKLILKNGRDKVETLDDSSDRAHVYLVFEENEELTPVQTIDSKAAGITMKMFNYSSPALIGGGSYGSNGGSITQGLLSSTIAPGQEFPTLTKKSGSLSEWFTGGTEANNLFIKSVYDNAENPGYFSFNSSEYGAFFDQASGNFSVYEQLTTPTNENNYFYKRGNFLPFNTIAELNKSTNKVKYDYMGNALSAGQPHYDQQLYLPDQAADFFFGMSMKANFTQPRGGQVNNRDMIFEFTGDDDIWVYIDDTLVLDLGGIHDAQSGSINFATGEVRYTDTKTNQAVQWKSTTIKAMFNKAGRSTADFNGNTFKPYTNHSIKMYYMERGAGASNLQMSFNIPPIIPSTVNINKQVTGLNAMLANQQEYKMKLFVDGKVMGNADYTITSGPNTGSSYKTAADGTFTLKNTQTATFNNIKENQTYYVQEIGTDGYEVLFNGTKKSNATSGSYIAGETPRIEVTNHYLQGKNLDITKQMADGVDAGNQNFTVLVTLGGSNYSGAYQLLDSNNAKISDGRTNNGQIQLKAGQTIRIEGLTVGTNYTVKEIATGTAYALDRYLVNGTAITSAVEAVGSITSSGGKVVVVNKEAPGTLTISKTVTGLPLSEIRSNLKNLNFTLGQGLPNVLLSEFDNFNSMQENANNVYTFTKQLKNIVAGTYTVEESGEILEGYSLETTLGENNGTVTVKPGENVNVSFTNAYKKSATAAFSFTVNKEWRNNVAPDNWSVQVTLVGVDASGNRHTADTITLNASKTTHTWKNLNPAYSYHAEETPSSGENWTALPSGKVQVGIETASSIRIPNCNIKEFPLPDNSAFVFSATGSVSSTYKNKFVLIVPQSTDDATLTAIKAQVKSAGGIFNKMDENNTISLRTGEIPANGIAIDTGKTVKYNTQTKTLTFSDTSIWQQVFYMTYSKTASQTLYNRVMPQANISLLGNKVLEGRTLAGDEFYFTIKANNDAPLYQNGNKVSEITVQNDAKGNFTFTGLRYTEADIGKTYTYTITEKVPQNSANGIVYDTTAHTVSVVVSQDSTDGPLTLTVKNGETVLNAANGVYALNAADAATFTNIYKAAGSFKVTGTKKLNRPISGGEFQVVMTEATEAFAPITGGKTISANVGADGKFTLENISFDETNVGTHYFVVSEVNLGDSSITYDAKTYNLTVVVADNKDGTLSFEVNKSPVGQQGYTLATGDAFNNSYAGTVQSQPITGTKTLAGRELAANQFTFMLTKTAWYNTADADKTNKLDSAVAMGTAKNTKDGAISFDAITYNQDDIGRTYVYTVTEDKAGTTSNGYTYSDAAYTVLHSIRYDLTTKAMVVDQTILDKAENPVDAIVFANSYAAAGSATIQAQKTLSGSTLKDGQFTFALYDATKTNVLGQVSNNSGNITFTGLAALKYTEAGEHTYYIHEQVGAQNAGYTYDDGWYKVVVKVTDKGNGVLSTANTYYDAAGELTADKGTTAPTLANKYAATGSIALTGTKALEYRNGMANGEFKVQLQEMDATFANKIGEAQLVDVAANGSFSIPLSYTEQNLGTHYYVVTEKTGTDSTIIYDTAAYKIAVTVTDSNNGRLAFAVEKIADVQAPLTAKGGDYALTPPGTATFTNTYKATGSFKVTGTKSFNRPIKAGEFTVQMQQLDAAGAPMVDVAPVTAVIGTDGTFTLNSGSFTAADIGKSYTYLVTEQQGADSNIIYAPNSYHLTVAVKDAGNGALSFTINNQEGLNAQTAYALTAENVPSIVNSYVANGALSIKGTKSINSRDLRDGEFSFKLSAQNGAPLYNGSSKVAEKLVSNQGGEFVFDGLRYTQDDMGKTYTYLLTEAATNAAGITTDSTQYTVNVTVADSASSNGALAFTIQTGSGAATSVNNNGAYTVAPATGHTATFDNKYAANISMQLTGTKAINDRTLRDGEFSFQIEALDNAPLNGATAGKLVVNNSGSNFTFTGLHFTQADIGHTYTYRITEKDNNVAGVAIDPTSYDVTVAVGYDAANDRLALTVNGATQAGSENTYALTPKADKTAAFENVYAAEVEQSITGVKTLANAAMTANQFQFILAGADAQSQAKAATLKNLTVGNPAAAKEQPATFDFGVINYTQADLGKTFTYNVSEVIPAGAETTALNGIIYDKTVFTVTHTVRYNAQNNSLAVDTAITGNENSPASAIVFANVYEAAGSKVLKAHKSLSGRPLAAEQFEFTLSDESGAKLQTVKNDASGNVVFEALNYTTADIGKTFTYTIQETAKNAAGYTYDAHAYKVEVKVEDGGNGGLNITAAYYDANNQLIENGEAAPIANTYAATGTVTVNGSKLLENVANRKMKANEFSFKLQPLNGAPLKDENGNALTELVAQNGADGKFAFAPIYFTESDIGDADGRTASYEYKVTEVRGTDGTLTYDNTEFTVVVTISDEAGNAKLQTNWSVKSAADADAKIVFTNRYETVDIGVTKEWIDNNNADRLRPQSITYNLVANGDTQNPVATAKVTATSHWQALFKGYPKYDTAHTPITYTVVEDAVEYYETEVHAVASTTEGTLTQLPITVRNTIQLGNLTLEKRLPVAEYNPALGEAIFTFDVASTSQENLAYKGIMLQIDENSSVEGDTYVARITLRGVPVGEYTVTERKDLRYESINGDAVTVLVQSAAQESGATVLASFTNRLTNEEYFSYASAVVNVYDPTTGEYVPTKISELGGTDGVIVIHGGTEEIITEQVVTDPFASRDVVLVNDNRTGKVAGGDDDDDDGGETPAGTGPNGSPAGTAE
ncbi:Spy0128 family protein [Pygmaiobacter massiliensis]|uniref:Spy0128 family protein n=1 Tax=Pygmaiobacter massiliensis TaxID=1917873 RepID=UPI0028A21BD9|nr:FctA domain-containing protein [Pygmaiobacter massiliensis]